MSDATMAAARSGRQAPRWMLVVLIASLGVNFLVIGLTVGAVWRFRGPPPLAGITPNLLGYASSLPGERRKMLWHETETERLHLRPFRREVRAAREDTLKALVEEPFDQEKFLSAQKRQGDAEERARAAVRALYAKIASGLTAQERRAFPRWRDQLRPPGSNLLDEPDQPAQRK